MSRRPRRLLERVVCSAYVGLSTAAIGILTITAPALALDEPTPTQTAETPPVPREDYGRVATFTVSPQHALPGGLVRATGTCTLAGSPATEVMFFLAPLDRDLGEIAIRVPPPGSDGRFDADVRIPDDVPPGPYDLGMLCALDDMVFGGTAEDIRFTVLTPETPTPDPSPTPTPTPTPTAPIVHADDRPATTGGATDELAATGASTSTAAIAATTLAAVGLSALLMHRRRSRRNS